MSLSEEHRAAIDFQSPNPTGNGMTEADKQLEADIQHARFQGEQAMTRVAECRQKMEQHAMVARSFYVEMSQLVAQRSPEQVARMEQEKGLSKS